MEEDQEQRRGPGGCLAEALELLRARQWASAQRLLEEIARRERTAEVAQYLAEVRAVRRYLRQLVKWPRDASLHLELGWLYFGLELGGEALESFDRAAELNPNLASAYYGMALEHLFRDEVAAARRASAIAHDLNPEFSSFGELQDTFERADRNARRGAVDRVT